MYRVSKKKKHDYCVYVYRGDGFCSRLVTVFPFITSLHDAIKTADTSLMVFFKLGECGKCKIMRDGKFIGNVEYDSTFNSFIFFSLNNPFQTIIKNERKH